MRNLLKLVGLGLSIDTITLVALRELLSCDTVLIDRYTSLWYPDVRFLEELLRSLGLSAEIVGRDRLEGRSVEELIEDARSRNVCIAVVGDPLTATTHNIFITEASKRGVKVEIVNGLSILGVAMSLTCLQPYRFGKIVTVVSSKNGIVYTYPLRVLYENRSRNLHTILLLEMDTDKGYFMKPPEAIKILLEAQQIEGIEVLKPNDSVVILEQVYGTGNRVYIKRIEELASEADDQYRYPPYTLVIPAPKLHPVEEECLEALARGFVELPRRSIDEDIEVLKNVMQIVRKLRTKLVEEIR